MIQIEELKKMLEIETKDLKDLDDQKLRVLLGCLHYASRVVTREINQRDISADNI